MGATFFGPPGGLHGWYRDPATQGDVDEYLASLIPKTQNLLEFNPPPEEFRYAIHIEFG